MTNITIYTRVRDKYPYLGYVRRWDELVGTIVEVVR